MKVSQLIEQLSKLPQEAPIKILYDLGCVNSIDCVWLARDGNVYVTDDDQWFGNDDYWPSGAKANFKCGYDNEMTDWQPAPIL